MPLFISDSELLAAGSDVALVVDRADAYIQDLLQQLEASKARGDAAAITTEQRTAVVEQKFLAMSSRFKEIENEKAQLESSLQRRSAEIAQVQAQLHKFELESMKQDSERERIMCELNELRKARRELLDVVEQKNSELNEKNTYIKSYLDKIVFLTDERSNLEGKLHEAEAELGRSQAAQARLAQEKELLEQHNSWLNEELTDKLDTLLKERRSSSELEMELRAKLGTTEQLCKDTEESLQRNKELLKDIESRLNQTREDLKFTRENAELKENHLSLEVETASKLVDLYKQSTEEWSKKATDLEGVIKALEVHLNQVEEESKKNLEKEVEARQVAEKSAMEAQDKIDKIEKDLESYKKAKQEDSVFFLSNVSSKESDQELAIELHELHKEPSLPIFPSGISGTALAATLIRDGWSITKIYIKYQEAVDAWRHEKQERKHSQALLQRVLQEIEQRAEQILDERAEHARMVEAYALMEEKLHSSVEEQNLLENHIRELKAELRKKERDLNSSNQECIDLQSQVATLLKECTDIRHRANGQASQLECGSRSHDSTLALTTSDAVVSDRLLTFKDIHELVQQNSQLRAVVRSLGHQNEEREVEMKEAFQLELKRRTDEASQKVSTILRKSEEQTHLISSLQGTVGMYKRLYEEALKSNNIHRKDNSIIAIDVSETNGDDVRTLVIKSEEETEKVRKEASERLSALENDLAKARQEANSARMERDRLIVEATYAREQLQTILKDSENKRKEMDSVLARNVEFSQIITDYQRRIRESTEHVQSVEEKCRRLSVEVTVLEREKELISNAEKRASQELSSLSDRVHRLQATLDNIHTVEEAQESMRVGEKKKLEEEVNRMQKEWVEMKHELDSERAHSRHLSNERDQAVKQAMDKIESISKELADALSKVSVFETRALVAEARCKELEANIKKTEEKALRVALRKGGKDVKGGDVYPDTELLSQLEQAKEEIEHLKEEVNASKSHSDQYKQLAQMNESALLKVEEAHNRFKEEAEKTKEVMNSELSALRGKIKELEKIVSEKENELMAAEANSLSVKSAVEKEVALLRESESEKRILLEQSEERIKALKVEVDKEHQMWRNAQSNYERQVLLQADTIRELTTASECNENLRREVEELRSKAQIATSDLDSLRVTWEMEKATLLSEHEKLNRKINELEEQNRILLDRVESKHFHLAESVKLSGDATKSTEHAESDLQDVIRYLRRSKETSDVEISLLKQERARLQKQLQSALIAAEEAQANLRRECENTRVTLCSEEEFKSLQSQVREMTLLRESNSQLRMENKRNFEECQSLRGSLQSKQEEVESLQKLLRERELEMESLMKDVDLHKAEVTRWENRSSQLLQKMKAFDIEEHNKIKSELQSAQETLKLRESEMDSSRSEIARHQELLHKLEQEISSKDEKISDLEKRIQETEAAAKAENDKYRRHALQFKRRLDVVTKEKEEQSKQMDELKTGSNKRGLGESHRSEAEIRQEISAQHELALKENENLLKEKETRIQTLERTLEKEREELRKEKARRAKDQKLYYEALQKQNNERTKLLEEVNVLKREKESLSENPQSKKLGRKIIRPKMDSPVEPQIQPEVSDPGTETTIEIPESDMETREDTKPAVTDISENATTTTAIVVASNPSDDVISIRKRSSAEAHGSVEEGLGQSSKHEILPVQKKQKGLDLKPIAMNSESQQTVTETVVTTEVNKSGSMDLDQGLASDTPAVDNKSSDMSTIMIEAETVSNTPLPVSTETIATKRSRIVRSDGLQPSIQRDDGPIVSDERNMPETSSLKEIAEQSITAGEDSMHISEASVPSSLSHEVPHAAIETVSRNDPEQTAPDTSDLTHLQTQLQDTIAVTEIDATENIVVDLSDIPEQVKDSTNLAVILETDTTEKEITMDPSPVVEGSVEAGEGEVEAPTDGVDIEDGEIEPEDAEDSNVESTYPPVTQNEDKTPGNASTDVSEEVTQQQDEQPQSLTSEPSQNESQSASGPSESQNQLSSDQKTEDKATPKVLTRQVKRGTTINISERARERSIGRRSGMPPPSPGRRTTRWTKRTAASQRERESANDVETEGLEEDKNADTPQTGSPAQRDQE